MRAGATLAYCPKSGDHLFHTGGGGRHYYFRYPSSGMAKVAHLGPGIDLKHDGGYIIAPPSRHISGGIYHWETSRPILSIEQVPEFPQKLLDLIPKRTEASSLSADELLWFERKIKEGRRNSILFKVAVRHVKLGVPVRVLASDMYSQNAARCDPPLPLDEVKSIIKSSLRYRTGVYFNSRACPLPAHPDVPKMTTEMLPDVVARLALDQAHRLNSSIEFTVVPMMCALAAALGIKVGIHPKQQDPWLVHPMVWGMVVSSPGTMKSPLANSVLREVYKLEDTAASLYEARVPDSTSPNDQSGGDESAAPHNPHSRHRLITNDVTPEKLIDLMAHNPNGLLLAVDELSALFESFEKQSMSALKHVLKTAYSGDMPINQDRILRGTTKAKNTAISIFGTIQPRLIEKMSKTGVLEKLLVDGFLQRFMLLAHTDAPEEYEFVDQPADDAAFAAYKSLLHQFTFSPGDLIQSTEPLGDPPYKFRFTQDAMVRYIEWCQQNALTMSRTDHHHMVEYRHKMRGFVPALALITELADRFGHDHGRGLEVTLASLNKAIKLAEYGAGHANRLYASSLSHSVKKAQMLLDKILDGSIEPPFKIRDVYRMSWRGLAEKRDVVQAVKVLIEYNWLMEAKGRSVEKHGAEFLVNPDRP